MWIKRKYIRVNLVLFILLIISVCSISNVIANGTKTKVIPRFITGVYSAETDDDFKKVKAAGIDFVLSYRFFGSKNNPKLTSMGKKIEYLDSAHAHGLKVLVPLSCYQMHQGDFKGIEGFVKKIKDHPALGMWYLYDEPKPHLEENIKTACKILKKETPHIPTAICMNWVKGWADWRKYVDILLLDIYPVGLEDFPNAPLNNSYNFTKSGVKFGTPIIPVVQIYARLIPPKRTKRGRFPNEIESRFMVYSQLTLGIRGLFWYSYYWGKKFDKKAYLEKIFLPLVKEIKEFEKLVGDLSKAKSLRKNNNKNGIYAGYWSSKKGKYLVVLNAKPLSRDIGAYVPVVKGKQLHPIGKTSGGVISVKKNNVNVKAGPWETFVWKVKK